MTLYFSGTHGAGKSTLIKEICTTMPDTFIAYPDRLIFPKVEEPMMRNRSKIVKYFYEHLDQQNFAQEHPGKIVIGDRCIYDGFVYGRAFQHLGWMTEDEVRWNEHISEILLPHFPDSLVVVNPPLETIMQRLHHRWEEKEKKWQEDDPHYLRAVHEEFRRLPDYYHGKSLLLLDEDLTVEDEVQRFRAWTLEQGLYHQHPLEALVQV